MKPSYSRKRAARIKFFALYMLSIVLIVVMLSSFFQPVTTKIAERKAPVQEANKLVAIDELLHARSGQYQAILEEKYGGNADPVDVAFLEKGKATQLAMVDSIRLVVSDWEDEKEKKDAETLLSAFVSSLQWQNKLAARKVVTTKNTAVATPDRSVEEVAQLKNLLKQKEAEIAAMGQNNKVALEERDKIITSLRNRPVSQPAPVVQKTPAGGALEWIAKYNKLKTTSDRNNAQFNNLQASYREVIADNRRLLTQLQMLKAGKN